MVSASKLILIGGLAVFSAIIVYSYGGASASSPVAKVSRNLKAKPSERRLFARRLEGRIDELDMDVNDYIDQRIMAITKSTWPKCVENRMDAIECKVFIDDEIWTQFKDRDQYIRVIIKGKRNPKDAWYNAIVIEMDDNGMTRGRDGDGIIYYDFEWDGSGNPTTPDQEAEIPPVLATETAAGSPNADPETNDAANPNSPAYEPLILETEPILVVGASVKGARNGSDRNPIGGGVVPDPDVPNGPGGDDKLADAQRELDEATNPDGSVLVEGAGARVLPAYDCEGLTGYNCCLMIRMKVRDADAQGKAIQCQIMYTEGSNKEKFWLNARGKKVFIFANHNEIVSKIPEIVGGWPKGKDDADFHEWLADGGDPNQFLYK